MPLSSPRDSERRDLRSLDEVIAVIDGLNHARAAGPAAADATTDATADATATGASSARIIVGIAGSPGSGKSTLGSQLVDRLNAASSASASSSSSAVQSPRDARAVLLPMDGFHLPQSRLVELGRRDRMGAPDTFDVAGFVATLRALRAADRSAGGEGDAGDGSDGGETPDPVLVPGFDREIEEPVPDAMSIPASARVVVVEGNYLLMQSGGWQEVLPLLDVSYFVDLERGIRLERLIARHERFGKSPDAARDWALGPDEANARLIEESAAWATHRIRLD